MHKIPPAKLSSICLSVLLFGKWQSSQEGEFKPHFIISVSLPTPYNDDLLLDRIINKTDFHTETSGQESKTGRTQPELCFSSKKLYWGAYCLSLPVCMYMAHVGVHTHICVHVETRMQPGVFP